MLTYEEHWQMIATDEGTQLLTVGEAAKVLRLRPSTVRSWVLKRKIQFIKLGGKVLFRRVDCDALVAASIVPPIKEGELTVNSESELTVSSEPEA